MADRPADPDAPDSNPDPRAADAPQPGSGTPGGPLESGTAAAPHSALAGAAEVTPEQARRAIDRNRFLAGATVGVGGLMGAAIAVPSLAFVLAPAVKTSKYYDVDLGPTSLYPVNKDKPFTVVTFEREPNDTSGIHRRVAFIRNDGNGTFTALSNTCMHLGCPVRNFGPSFGCPCHGGQYDAEGRRTAGPPARPLNRYETKVDDQTGHLLLGALYAVDDKLVRHQLQPPGTPVTGLLSYLYPPAPQ